MSFDSADTAFERPNPLYEASSRDGVQCVARLARALESLGPVLLVQRTRSDTDTAWTLCSAVDAHGVREFVQAGPWRLYRLPDSDYLGWDRLAGLCRCSDAAADIRKREPGRASLARVAAQRWQGVSRLSPIGWDVTREILGIEAAQLCRAAWEN
jgi:hypothetical protein